MKQSGEPDHYYAQNGKAYLPNGTSLGSLSNGVVIQLVKAKKAIILKPDQKLPSSAPTPPNKPTGSSPPAAAPVDPSLYRGTDEVLPEVNSSVFFVREDAQTGQPKYYSRFGNPVPNDVLDLVKNDIAAGKAKCWTIEKGQPLPKTKLDPPASKEEQANGIVTLYVRDPDNKLDDHGAPLYSSTKVQLTPESIQAHGGLTVKNGLVFLGGARIGAYEAFKGLVESNPGLVNWVGKRPAGAPPGPPEPPPPPPPPSKFERLVAGAKQLGREAVAVDNEIRMHMLKATGLVADDEADAVIAAGYDALGVDKDKSTLRALTVAAKHGAEDLAFNAGGTVVEGGAKILEATGAIDEKKTEAWLDQRYVDNGKSRKDNGVRNGAIGAYQAVKTKLKETELVAMELEVRRQVATGEIDAGLGEKAINHFYEEAGISRTDNDVRKLGSSVKKTWTEAELVVMELELRRQVANGEIDADLGEKALSMAYKDAGISRTDNNVRKLGSGALHFAVKLEKIQTGTQAGAAILLVRELRAQGKLSEQEAASWEARIAQHAGMDPAEAVAYANKARQTAADAAVFTMGVGFELTAPVLDQISTQDERQGALDWYQQALGGSKSRTNNEVFEVVETRVLPGLEMVSYAMIETGLRGLKVPGPVAAAVAAAVVQLAKSAGDRHSLGDTLFEVAVAAAENGLASAAAGKLDAMLKARLLPGVLKGLTPEMRALYQAGNKEAKEVVNQALEKGAHLLSQQITSQIKSGVVDQAARIPVLLAAQLAEHTKIGPDGRVEIDPKWREEAAKVFSQAAVNLAVNMAMHHVSKGLPLGKLKDALISEEHAPSGQVKLGNGTAPRENHSAPPVAGAAHPASVHPPVPEPAKQPTKQPAKQPAKPAAATARPRGAPSGIPDSLPKAARPIGVDRKAIALRIADEFQGQAKELRRLGGEARAGKIAAPDWDARSKATIQRVEGEIQKVRAAADKLAYRGDVEAAEQMRAAAREGEKALAEMRAIAEQHPALPVSDEHATRAAPRRGADDHATRVEPRRPADEHATRVEPRHIADEHATRVEAKGPGKPPAGAPKGGAHSPNQRLTPDETAGRLRTAQQEAREASFRATNAIAHENIVRNRLEEVRAKMPGLERDYRAASRTAAQLDAAYNKARDEYHRLQDLVSKEGAARPDLARKLAVAQQDAREASLRSTNAIVHEKAALNKIHEARKQVFDLEDECDAASSKAKELDAAYLEARDKYRRLEDPHAAPRSPAAAPASDAHATGAVPPPVGGDGATRAMPKPVADTDATRATPKPVAESDATRAMPRHVADGDATRADAKRPGKPPADAAKGGADVPSQRLTPEERVKRLQAAQQEARDASFRSTNANIHESIVRNHLEEVRAKIPGLEREYRAASRTAEQSDAAYGKARDEYHRLQGLVSKEGAARPDLARKLAVAQKEARDASLQSTNAHAKKNAALNGINQTRRQIFDLEDEFDAAAGKAKQLDDAYLEAQARFRRLDEPQAAPRSPPVPPSGDATRAEPRPAGDKTRVEPRPAADHHATRVEPKGPASSPAAGAHQPRVAARAVPKAAGENAGSAPHGLAQTSPVQQADAIGGEPPKMVRPNKVAVWSSDLESFAKDVLVPAHLQNATVIVGHGSPTSLAGLDREAAVHRVLAEARPGEPIVFISCSLAGESRPMSPGAPIRDMPIPTGAAGTGQYPYVIAYSQTVTVLADDVGSYHKGAIVPLKPRPDVPVDFIPGPKPDPLPAGKKAVSVADGHVLVDEKLVVCVNELDGHIPGPGEAEAGALVVTRSSDGKPLRVTINEITDPAKARRVYLPVADNWYTHEANTAYDHATHNKARAAEYRSVASITSSTAAHLSADFNDALGDVYRAQGDWYVATRDNKPGLGGRGSAPSPDPLAKVQAAHDALVKRLADLKAATKNNDALATELKGLISQATDLVADSEKTLKRMQGFDGAEAPTLRPSAMH